jgi:hypothetical protein
MDDVPGMAYALAQGIESDPEDDQVFRGCQRRAIDRQDEFSGTRRANGEGAQGTNALSKYNDYMRTSRARAAEWHAHKSLYE